MGHRDIHVLLLGFDTPNGQLILKRLADNFPSLKVAVQTGLYNDQITVSQYLFPINTSSVDQMAHFFQLVQTVVSCDPKYNTYKVKKAAEIAKTKFVNSCYNYPKTVVESAFYRFSFTPKTMISQQSASGLGFKGLWILAHQKHLLSFPHVQNGKWSIEQNSILIENRTNSKSNKSTVKNNSNSININKNNDNSNNEKIDRKNDNKYDKNNNNRINSKNGKKNEILINNDDCEEIENEGGLIAEHRIEFSNRFFAILFWFFALFLRFIFPLFKDGNQTYSSNSDWRFFGETEEHGNRYNYFATAENVEADALRPDVAILAVLAALGIRESEACDWNCFNRFRIKLEKYELSET